MRHSWIAGNFGKASSRLLAVQFLDMYMTEQEPWMDAFRNSLAAQDLTVGSPLEFAFHEDQIATIAEMHTKVSDALTVRATDLTSRALRAQRNQLLAFNANSLINYLNTNFSTAQAAWFASSQFEGSGRWLGAPCCALQHPALVLSDREFHAALRMRLLLQNAVSNDHMLLPTHCRCPHPTPLNPAEPLHMLDERASNHTEYHARHNACRDVLARVMQRLPNVHKVDVVKEHELPGQEDIPEARRTRADVLAICKATINAVPQRFVFDIAVTNPAATTFRTQYAGHRDNPAGSFYGAALARQAQKQARYARFQLDDSFIPFAIDATGRLGPEAMRFMERAFKIDDRTPNYKNKALYLQARLGAACMKVNAQIVIRSAHALAQRARVEGIAVD